MSSRHSPTSTPGTGTPRVIEIVLKRLHAPKLAGRFAPDSSSVTPKTRPSALKRCTCTLGGTSGAIRAWIEHWANLQCAFVGLPKDIDVELQELLAQPDRLFLRWRLKNGEAADEFLRFGERPIGHRHLSSRNPHTGALGAGQQAP